MQGNDSEHLTAGARGQESTRGWVATVVHNLYGHPDEMAPPSTFVERPGYRRLRAGIVAHGLEQPVIQGIKLTHTAVFASLMGLVLYVTLAGIRGRFGRRALAALLVIGGEALIVTVNGGGCPLTGVVEDLGAEHGSVSDIFLPDWVARHIPHFSSALLAAGLAALAARRVVRLLTTRG